MVEWFYKIEKLNPKERKTWKEYFERHIEKKGIAKLLHESWLYHNRILQEIIKLKIKKVAELGSGIGASLAIPLAAYNHDVTGFDICPDSIRIAKEIRDNLKINIKYEINDALRIGTEYENHFDLVYSMGVLEHFMEYKEAIAFLKTHITMTRKYVMIGVPSKFSKDEGIEQFNYSVSELKRICKDVGIKEKKTFTIGHTDRIDHFIHKILPPVIFDKYQNLTGRGTTHVLIGEKQQW